MATRNGARRGLITILVVGLFTLASATGVAFGASGPARTGFAAQARELGLTSAQAHDLQKRVDAYLSTTGGTQVAVNKIRLGDRGEILLTLPGERTARDTKAPRRPDVELCPG